MHAISFFILSIVAINHPGTIKAAFLMNSVPIHGQRYHCHRTGKLISTDEEMVEHGKFLDSLGFHGEDEESCYKAWFRICPTIPDVGSSAMKRFHYGAMNFRAGLGAHSANSKFNIAPIKTIRSAPSDALKDLQVPIIVLHGSNDTVVDSLIVRSVTNLAIKEKWATNDLLSYYEHKSNHFPFYENVNDWADTYRRALEENLK